MVARKRRFNRVARNKKRQCVDTDRISGLPELVLHLILSFLPMKAAAGTSMLSKRWKGLWDTLPYLKFGCEFFDIPDSIDDYIERLEKQKELLDIAGRTILKRKRRPNSSIEKLHLFIPAHKFPKRKERLENPLYFELERWISCVARRSLRELVLFNRCKRGHSLPSSIFSAKSLNVLSLCGFSLGSWSSHDIEFLSLRKLCLNEINLDDGIMANIIMGCPSMEDLQLRRCYGFKSIYVTGLLKLKLLYLEHMWALNVLEIDAPELESLSVLFISSKCRFNVKNTCTLIKKLALVGKFVTTNIFQQLVSQCLFLQDMTIGCTNLENIKISSDILKTLEVLPIWNLVDVDITAPALEKISFHADTYPTLQLNISDMLKLRLNFSTMSSGIWIDQLNNFLGYFSKFTNVILHWSRASLCIPLREKWDSCFSVLRGTKNLVFSSYISNTVEVELVEFMLWLSPSAETLSIIRKDYQKGQDITLAFIKLVHDQNRLGEDLSPPPCCKYLHMPCWRHCLAEVEIKKFEEDGDNMTRLKNFFSKNVKDLKIVG